MKARGAGESSRLIIELIKASPTNERGEAIFDRKAAAQAMGIKPESLETRLLVLIDDGVVVRCGQGIFRLTGKPYEMSIGRPHAVAARTLAKEMRPAPERPQFSFLVGNWVTSSGIEATTKAEEISYWNGHTRFVAMSLPHIRFVERPMP